MRIEVDYLTRYDYAAPARQIVQTLRMTPRDHEGQYVRRWRVELDTDARLRPGEDAFANLTHTLWLAGPVRRLTVRAIGEVDTFDTGGVVRGAVERFPPTVYLRDTPLTACDAAIAALAERAAAASGERLGHLHALLSLLHGEMTFDVGHTDAATSAPQAYALGRGVCQDLSHIFIAAARRLGAPARYVSGHLARGDGEIDQPAAHAWAEAHVEGLGWVGFDPANGVCPTEAYVRVATGLDYLGASPVRGSRLGGAGEHLDVRLRVTAGQ